VDKDEVIERLEAWINYRRLANVWDHPTVSDALRDLLKEALKHLKEAD
jgi:hypothetical protein